MSDKNRFITDIMIVKIHDILKRIGEYGPPQGIKSEGSACAFCDMGVSGWAIRGDGFHDDNCAVKDAQLLHKEIFDGQLICSCKPPPQNKETL